MLKGSPSLLAELRVLERHRIVIKRIKGGSLQAIILLKSLKLAQRAHHYGILIFFDLLALKRGSRSVRVP